MSLDTTGQQVKLCKACEKEIPAESVFCMHCGERQLQAETIINTSSPVYIATAEFWLSGPRDFKPGGWRSADRVGRWINFAIALRDKSDKYTACNGVLSLGVISHNYAIDVNSPAEKILDRLKEKSLAHLGTVCKETKVAMNSGETRFVLRRNSAMAI